MAIANDVVVLPAALWPQGDIRDPLGVWGFRLGITGDASGGSIKTTAIAPAGDAAAYIFTCYALTFVQLSGAIGSASIKSRLLTNWPNVDVIPGVQGFSTYEVLGMSGGSNFTPPTSGVGSSNSFPINNNARFILLFDPRPSAGPLAIVEMELNENVNLATYSAEGYGYFWDRSVLNAPGGPRHPGAS